MFAGRKDNFSLLRFSGVMLLSLCLVVCPFFGAAVQSHAVAGAVAGTVAKVASGAGGGGILSTGVELVGSLGKSVLEAVGVGYLADEIGSFFGGIFGDGDVEEQAVNYNTWITNNNYNYYANGSFTLPLYVSSSDFSINGFSLAEIRDGAIPNISDLMINSTSFQFYNEVWTNYSVYCPSQNFSFDFPCNYSARWSHHYMNYNLQGNIDFQISSNHSFDGHASSGSSFRIVLYDPSWAFHTERNQNSGVIVFSGTLTVNPSFYIPFDYESSVPYLVNNYYDYSSDLYDYSVTNVDGDGSDDGGFVLLNAPEVNPQALWYRMPSINFPGDGIGSPITDLQVKMPDVDFTNGGDLDINDIYNYITLPDGSVVPVSDVYTYDFRTRTFGVTSADDNSISYSIVYGDENLTVTKFDSSDNSVDVNTYYYAIYNPSVDYTLLDGNGDTGLNGGNGGDGGNGGNGGGTWTPVFNTSGGSITFSGGNFDVNVAGLVDLITAPFRAMYQLIEGLANALMESVQSAIALMSDVSGYVGVFMDYVRTWFSWLPEPVQAVLFSGFGIFFTVSIFRLFRGG